MLLPCCRLFTLTFIFFVTHPVSPDALVAFQDDTLVVFDNIMVVFGDSMIFVLSNLKVVFCYQTTNPTTII